MKTTDKTKYGFILMMVSLPILLIILFVSLTIKAQDLSVSQRKSASQSKTVHSISSTKGLKLVWQLENVHATDYMELKSYMMAVDQKVFFRGSLGSHLKAPVSVFSGSDGSLLGKTNALDLNSSFTTDGAYIYVAYVDGGGKVFKYDFVNNRTEWEQDLGNIRGPCCIHIWKNELRMDWYPYRYVSVSTKDGKKTMELRDVGTNVLYSDNVIFTRAGNGIEAVGFDRNIIWFTRLGNEVLQAPAVTRDIIFVRTGRETGRVYAIRRSTGAVIWRSKDNVLSNVAVSSTRAYFLTTDGSFYGVNHGNGEIKALVKLDPENFFVEDYDGYTPGFEVAYDQKLRTVFLLMGDTNQLMAFREKD